MPSQPPVPPPGPPPQPPGPPSEPPAWQPSPGPYQPPQRRGLLRFGRGWLIAGLGAFLAIIIAVVVIVTMGGGNFTAHGTSQDCDGVENDGDQVTVLDSSQHVIGTGTLATDNSKAAAAIELQYYNLQRALGSFGSSNSSMNIYDFTVSGLPSGLPRYGVQIGSGHGTVWFSEQEMRKGPGLNLGC